MCFTPDAHTAAGTRDQRTFLATCGKTRQRAIKSLSNLTLYRLNPSDGEVTEYNMWINLEQTCLCIDGWMGLGLSLETGGGKARGLDFTRDVKRVAFVIHDRELERRNMVFSLDLFRSDETYQFPFLFHNARYISAITSSALVIRKLLGHEVFFTLFSFQPFEPKRLVQGFHMTKPRTERRKLLCDAMESAFEGWNGRIREALDQAGLLKVLERIERENPKQFQQTYFSGSRVREVIKEPSEAVPYLVRQAIRHNWYCN